MIVWRLVSSICIFGLSLLLFPRAPVFAQTYPADITGDNAVTGADYAAFLPLFVSQDLLGDVDANGSVDIFDLNAIIVAIPTLPPSLSQIPIFFTASTQPTATGSYELIEYFNAHGRETDTISFGEASLLENPERHVEAMQAVSMGEVVQSFSSWQTAKDQLAIHPELLSLTHALSYDLERWDQSRNEWENIASASAAMADLARQYNLKYYAHLSYQLANNNAEDPQSIEHMAEYADGYGVAAYPCLTEYDISYCAGLYRQMADRAKAANPFTLIIVNISLENDTPIQDTRALLEEIIDVSGAIGPFFYPGRPESIQKFWEFLAALR
ncbi:MAG: hypothetical protein Q7S76_00880 [bacterium]|nr:hypothetical protein [bacterium]